MRRATSSVLVLTLLLANGGCQFFQRSGTGEELTPGQQIQMAKTTLAAIVEELNEFRAAGFISDAQFEHIFAVETAAKSALDDMENANGAGNMTLYRTALKSFEGYVNQLQRDRAVLEK